MSKRTLSPLKRKPLRNPGQTLDEEIQRILDDKVASYFWFPACFVLLAGLEWVAYFTKAPRQPWTFTAVAAMLSCWAAWKIIKLKAQIKSLKLGRDGERAVGQYLERLRSMGAHVLHDVPADNFNLDHVVICDRGLFVIETKTWSKPHENASVTLAGGALSVGGYLPDRDPVTQVQAEMSWLVNMLEESTGKRFPVRGALVFPGWFVAPELKNACKDMWVLEPKALPKFIEHEPVRIAIADVALALSRLTQLVQSKS